MKIGEIDRFASNSTLGISLGRLVLFVLSFTIFDSVFRYISIGIASVESVFSSLISGMLLGMILGSIFSRLSYQRLTQIVMAWFSLFIIQSLSNLVEAVFFTTAITTATIFMAALVFGIITTFPEALLVGILFSLENIDSSFRVDLRSYFSKRTITACAGRLWSRVAVILIVFFPILLLIGAPNGDPTRLAGGIFWQSFVLAIWEQLTCVAIIVALAVLFRDRYNSQGVLAKAISESTYTAYIIHAPIIILLALALREVQLPLLLKWMFVSCLAVPMCFTFSYYLRRLPIARTRI